ncbi:hypothetical protein [Amycolatopsis suaedae]|uniref:hypothetical protein n=1 Tax=Amycolatopsis suaedae TaxID=2510978 RepID=UPI0013EF4F74|nr:hypothetical protein [Amycolatopsis suaedae]
MGKQKTPAGRSRTRTDAVVSWTAWHLGEEAAVLAPAAVAWVAGSPWPLAGSAVAALVWAGHEVRQRRNDRRPPRPVDTGEQPVKELAPADRSPAGAGDTGHDDSEDAGRAAEPVIVEAAEVPPARQREVDSA